VSHEERWRLRVSDILEAVRRISGYLEGMSAEAFYQDQRTIDAVVRNIAIIGEAARHVPADLRSRHADIPWDQMRGMRNVIIHEYDIVDVEIVWETAQTELPALIVPLERILSGE